MARFWRDRRQYIDKNILTAQHTCDILGDPDGLRSYMAVKFGKMPLLSMVKVRCGAKSEVIAPDCNLMASEFCAITPTRRGLKGALYRSIELQGAAQRRLVAADCDVADTTR